MLLPSPDATIALTVNQFLSVTQGKMVTSGANPQVTAAVSGSSRVSKRSDNSFEVSGGSSDPSGNPLVLQVEVLPKTDYDAVGLIIHKVSSEDDGGSVWDEYRVGSGTNANAVNVRDWARLSSTGRPITYEIFMLIKTKVADETVGDFGLIDPKITNL